MQWFILGYLPELKRNLGENFPHLILYHWSKFQCHTFFPSQDIKENALLSSYLSS